MKALVLCFLLLLASPAAAIQGFGSQAFTYHPMCCTACRRALGSNYLSCSFDGYVPGGMMDSDAASATPKCRAGNAPFLTSLAYCINTRCGGPDQLSVAGREIWWAASCTGSPDVPPMWSYGTALAKVEAPPTHVVMASENLTMTVLSDQDVYDHHFGTLSMVVYEENLHTRFGLGILLVAFGLPVALTLLSHVPHVNTIAEKVKPYLVWPSTVGTYHVRPLPHLLGNAPTMGQGIYIFVMIVLNVVLMGVSYRSYQPNLWYPTATIEICAYIVWRTGTFALALLPVVVLFSGRNNVLLWLSNWSHSTFMLLHRWLARLFALHVIIHSIVSVVYYRAAGNYESSLVEEWWIWGCVGTVAASAMLVFSLLWVRQAYYELFLITHVILAIFVFAGTWYHCYDLFMNMSGYEHWIYAALAAWGFDRALRLGRLFKNGVRRATITELGDGSILRVDVHGVRWGPGPGSTVYAYFPTVSRLRPWENHPFSAIPTAMLQPATRPASLSHLDGSASSDNGATPGEDRADFIEKSDSGAASDPVKLTTQPSTPATAPPGITLFTRRSTPGRRSLTTLLAPRTNVLTLLDGPYASGGLTPSFGSVSAPPMVARCDRLLLLAGGVGVTAVLPLVAFCAPSRSVKLAWSLREGTAQRALVDAVAPGLARALPDEADRLVKVGGGRLDVHALLEEEVKAGWGKIGVVVCGPPGMCDDARDKVVRAARMGGAGFELEVLAYSW